MISEADTRIKNEILRKIKYYDMKKNNLPDLVRKKREEILARRDQKQKEMLMNRNTSQESLLSTSINGTVVNLNLDRKNTSGNNIFETESKDIISSSNKQPQTVQGSESKKTKLDSMKAPSPLGQADSQVMHDTLSQ